MNGLIVENTNIGNEENEIDEMLVNLEFMNEIRPHHLREITKRVLTPKQKRIARKISLKFQDELKMHQGGLTDSSWAKLMSKWKIFTDYCMDNNYDSIPVEHEHLMRFIRIRAEKNNRNTVKGDVWAINYMHHSSGFTKPCSDESINALIKKYANQEAENSVLIKQATPFGLEDWVLIRNQYRHSSNIKELRDLAIIGVTFSCLLRFSELSRIKVGHIDFKTNQLLIPFSKTNKSSRPDYATIHADVINDIKDYMNKAGICESEKNAPLFIQVNKHNKPLVNKSGNDRIAVTYSVCRKMYAKLFDLCEINHPDSASFTTHSPRVGAAQRMWMKGTPVSKILKQGRWKTTEIASRYGQGYIMDNDVVNNDLFR